jgi:hypothetical protein
MLTSILDPAFIEKIRELRSQRQDWPRRIMDDDGYFEVLWLGAAHQGRA